MSKIVGLDIGTESIKAAVLNGSARRPRIKDFAVTMLPSNVDGPIKGDAIIEAINDIFEEHKLSRNQVSVGLTAAEAILRELTVPFVSDDQINKTIKFEVEGHIPFSVEDIVVDYHKIEESAGKSRLLTMVVKKDVIRNYLHLLAQCGIDPIEIDLDVVSFFNVAMRSNLCPDDSACTFLDIGRATTNLLVIDHHNLTMMRILRVGTEQIPPAAMSMMDERSGMSGTEGESEDANGILDSLATGTGESGQGEETPTASSEHDIEQTPLVEHIGDDRESTETHISGIAIQQFGAKLCREVKRSLIACPAANRISNIILTGGGSKLDGIEQSVQRETGIRTISLDLAADFEHEIPIERVETLDRFGAVAVGLGLKQLGGGRINTDFRKEELAYKRKFERIKLSLAACLFLALSFFTLLGYYIKSNTEMKIQRLKSLENEQIEIFKYLFEKKPELKGKDVLTRVGKSIPAQIKYQRFLLEEGPGGGSDIPRLISALDVLRDVMKLLPAQVKFELSDVRVTQEGMKLKGNSSDYSIGEKLQDGIQKSNIFSCRSPEQSTDKHDRDKIHFTLNIKYGDIYSAAD